MHKLIPLLCLLTFSLTAKPLIIGISGGSGSGKTTLSAKIQEQIPNAALICQDSYYNDISHLTIEERAQTNFDHPNSLEFSMLQEHLQALKGGNTVEIPIYDFHTHARTSETEEVHPSSVIIVEGAHLLGLPDLLSTFDLKIYVDCDDDERILRRVQRDIEERGRDFNSVHNQYLTTVKPMHDRHIAPTKKYADIIVPEGGYNEKALDLIVTWIKANL
ncbi:MAG: Uridine kinase [Chlamydiia bacterium]|nr:Uridine kinase [Chlamydiia bacterium]MCH9616177.1 Uridine kinase [Chlamydiia bacterium]MCH9629837.1 Uridine kinase [Chlamydiia bacterium]